MSTFIDLKPGQLAAMVTHLEMRALPPRDDLGLDRQDLRLDRVLMPSLDWYRDLFRHVGADWLWFGRLRLDDATLAQIIHDPEVEVYALYRQGQENPQGLLELDARDPGNIELAYFGVGPGLIGTGAGRHMMAFAIEQARAHGAGRFWVHTCAFDHPDAVAFYQRSGFTPYRREIEVFDDPRLDGTLPRTTAAHIPILG